MMKRVLTSLLLFASSSNAYTPTSLPDTTLPTETNPFVGMEVEPDAFPEELIPPPQQRNGAENIPGVVAPLGFFDPLGLSAMADGNTLQRYREAELQHGRVAMLAIVGILASETVAFGPAIFHLQQTPKPFQVLLLFTVSFVEIVRAEVGWVSPGEVPFDQPGLLRANYVPGNLGFDPLGLAPTDPVAFKDMQTKELQNGRLAMIAAAGAMAQEVVDKKGIVDHLLGMDLF